MLNKQPLAECTCQYSKLVSVDIGMEFDLAKCIRITFEKGIEVLTEGIQLDRHNVIEELESEATYIYLGTEEREGIEHHKVKAMIQKE